MTVQKYLGMQKNFYENAASQWSITNDTIVGTYFEHNSWEDYDKYLFKDFDTTDLIALEYGCGPGRNIIKFNNRFKRIDGVDIAQANIDKARQNLIDYNVEVSNLFSCDGESIPAPDQTYDVVFSVICMQHIACYDIRFNIFKEAHRVLKLNGYFCFQLGYVGRSKPPISGYYDNMYDVNGTNGSYDVSVMDANDLKQDLTEKLTFRKFKADIRPTGPGDTHANWVWTQVQK